MTKDDFISWKTNPVTKEVFSGLKARIAEIKEVLAESAGFNPLTDREYVGAIKAYTDMLEINYEGESEND